MRVIERQRSAPLAGDIVRPIVRLRAAAAEASDRETAHSTLRAPSSRAATAAITHRTAWAPLVTILRTPFAPPREPGNSVSVSRRSVQSQSRDLDAMSMTLRGAEGGRAAEVIPLVPSVGVATRVAVHAATQASAHATARALKAVDDAVPKRVAAQVRHDVAQAIERMTSSRAPSAPDASLVDDRFVAVLLGRMRAALREEQFRHGQIR